VPYNIGASISYFFPDFVVSASIHKVPSDEKFFLFVVMARADNKLVRLIEGQSALQTIEFSSFAAASMATEKLASAFRRTANSAGHIIEQANTTPLGAAFNVAPIIQWQRFYGSLGIAVMRLETVL
jgi:hypothetical protein